MTRLLLLIVLLGASVSAYSDDGFYPENKALNQLQKALKNSGNYDGSIDGKIGGINSGDGFGERDGDLGEFVDGCLSQRGLRGHGRRIGID